MLIFLGEYYAFITLERISYCFPLNLSAKKDKQIFFLQTDIFDLKNKFAF